MEDYPDVTLRMYGHYGISRNLGFLKLFHSLKNFQADSYNLDDLSGLRFLPPDLEYLGIGQTRSKRHSLSVLETFPNLKSLYIESHKKDIDTIGRLTKLEELHIRSITLPDLSIFLPLKELLSLKIKLGGTSNVSLLPKIGKIRYLEIWMVRGMTDLEYLSEMSDLQYLFLQAIKNATSLPSFQDSKQLRRVHLETMKGITNLTPIAEAPALEELVVIDMRHLQAESFNCFIDHHTLQNTSIGLGSVKKNNAVKELLSLPETGYGTDFQYE